MSAQAQAQLEAELVLILKYPEKLARKYILGIQTSYNPSSNLKHMPNIVNKLQMAGSSLKPRMPSLLVKLSMSLTQISPSLFLLAEANRIDLSVYKLIDLIDL